MPGNLSSSLIACKVSGASEGEYVLNWCGGNDDLTDTCAHGLGDEVCSTDRKVSVCSGCLTAA